MKKRKIGTIAVGAVVVCITVSLFLQNEVEGNLYDIKAKTSTTKVEVSYGADAVSYNIMRDKMLYMVLVNKDISDTYVKNVIPQVDTQELKAISKIAGILGNNDKQTTYKIVMTKSDIDGKMYLAETATSINKSVVSARRIELPVSYLSQYPELPTGCEVTSLTTVLNYLKYKVSKEDMADKYLPKCDLESRDFLNYFLGDPYTDGAYGCYSAPIITAANTYLKKQGNQYTAYDYSGSGFGTFLKEIEAGNPVIIWSTIDLERAYVSAEWTINGSDVAWISPEHCVVMIGYNLDANTVTLSDPMQGIVTVDMDLVNLRYTQMCSQAVVIKA